ncbi:MAG TPA: ABC transporter ATP-binding protein [Candidatus Nanoarchaeia archaeon]|nr:ABC transporter ATP-binding protein [Candidatus Nanoarchaeia archaeon]
MPLLQLKEVSKEFANSTVLDHIDMTIEEGDIIGIVGESGSGKTTLLNLLTGFMEPSQGEVLYYSKVTHEPKNLHDNLHKIKKFIGFAPQHNSFYPKLTVKENLFHFGQMYGLQHDILVSNIKSLLIFTGLFEDRNKLAEHLSGGMQKRLNISCGLVHKPKILVLDEPTADLDPLIQKEILLLLEEANKQGITVILASHHLDSVEHLCNKVAVIHKGKMRSFGSLDDIKKPFLRDYFTINLRPGDSKEKVLATLKTLPVKKIVDEGKRLVVYPLDIQKTLQGILAVIKEENLYLHDLDLRKPSLHEVFETIATGK